MPKIIYQYDKSGSQRVLRLKNPNWNQAMNGSFTYECWKTVCIELENLESMGSWDVLDHKDDMSIILLTWDFKLQWYPDGLIKYFKAILFDRDDMQLKVIYSFETYVPVVQINTISLMLILEILLQFKSKQGDTTAALIHAKLE